MNKGGWSSDGWPKQNARYEVGYGKPPPHTRFSPGKSGNPKGRSLQKRPNGAQILRKLLEENLTITENGVPKRLPAEHLIYKVLIAGALKGQPRASAQLFKLMQQYGLLDELDYKTNELVVRFMSNSDKKPEK